MFALNYKKLELSELLIAILLYCFIWHFLLFNIFREEKNIGTDLMVSMGSMHICHNIGTHLRNRFCRNICSGVQILWQILKALKEKFVGTRPEEERALVQLFHSLVQRFNALSCEEIVASVKSFPWIWKNRHWYLPKVGDSALKENCRCSGQIVASVHLESLLILLRRGSTRFFRLMFSQM